MTRVRRVVLRRAVVVCGTVGVFAGLRAAGLEDGVAVAAGAAVKLTVLAALVVARRRAATRDPSRGGLPR